MGHGENLTGLSSGKFHVESGAEVGARGVGLTQQLFQK